MFKRQNDARKFWNDWRTMFFFSRKSGVFAVAVAFRARDEASITCTRNIIVYRGVMNGPLKFLTARKILPLLDLLTKFKRVLACSCSPNFCVARKLAKQIVYFCSCSACSRMLAKTIRLPCIARARDRGSKARSVEKVDFERTAGRVDWPGSQKLLLGARLEYARKNATYLRRVLSKHTSKLTRLCEKTRVEMTLFLFILFHTT